MKNLISSNNLNGEGKKKKKIWKGKHNYFIEFDPWNKDESVAVGIGEGKQKRAICFSLWFSVTLALLSGKP